MALTFPISIPDYDDIQVMTIQNMNAVSRTASPYTFSQQVYEHAGDAFVFQFTLRPMFKADAGAWVAWLKALRGGANTCLIGDPHRRSPLRTASYAPGAPRVLGGSQTGGELNIDSLPANATGYLLEGDWIQLGTGSDSRIYMVLEDVDANGSGEATITISPELRTSPSDNAVVYVEDTECVCRLTNPNVEWTVGADHAHEIQFEAIEAL